MEDFHMIDVSGITGQNSELDEMRPVALKPDTKETFLAAYNETTTVTDALSTWWAKRGLTKESEANNAQMVSKDKLNEQYAGYGIEFDEDQYENVAMLMAEDRREKLKQREVMEQGGGLIAFAGGMAAHMMDPIEFGAGEVLAAAAPAIAGSIGLASKGFGEKVAGQMLGNLAVEPALIYDANVNGDEYTMGDFAMSVVAAPLLMTAGMHGLGKAAKLGKSAFVKSFRRAVAAANMDRNLDIHADLKIDTPQVKVDAPEGKIFVSADESAHANDAKGSFVAHEKLEDAEAIAAHHLKDEAAEVHAIDTERLNIADDISEDIAEIEATPNLGRAEKDDLIKMKMQELENDYFDGVKVINEEGVEEIRLFDTDNVKKARSEAEVISKPELQNRETFDKEFMNDETNKMHYDQEAVDSLERTSAEDAPIYKGEIAEDTTAMETEALEELKVLEEQGKIKTEGLEKFRENLKEADTINEGYQDIISRAINCMRG